MIISYYINNNNYYNFIGFMIMVCSYYKYYYRQCWAIGQFWTVLDSFGQFWTSFGQGFGQFSYVQNLVQTFEIKKCV